MEHSLNVALIEPEIPQNTGNIARTCAATGARLHLVGPMGFQITERRVRRAGLDYWDKLDITYYDDINDFFEKNKGANFFISPPRRSRHTRMPNIQTIASSFSARNQRACPSRCLKQIMTVVCVFPCAE